MWIIHDPDEWEAVVEHKDYGRNQFGNPIVSVAYYNRRRDPEEVAKIKAAKCRQHEDEILLEAEAIKRRRGI